MLLTLHHTCHALFDLNTLNLKTIFTRTQDLGPECQVPDSLAPCGDNSTTFYYDEGRGQCLRGEFGGCRYPNSYRSEEECERRCGAFKNYGLYQIIKCWLKFDSKL